jgi:hypothetical protein
MPANTTRNNIVDVLSGTALASGGGVTLLEFNTYLETATLILGFVAGCFAVYFHVKRFVNEPDSDDSQE